MWLGSVVVNENKPDAGVKKLNKHGVFRLVRAGTLPVFSGSLLPSFRRCRHQLLTVNYIKEIVLGVSRMGVFSTVNTNKRSPWYGKVELNGASRRQVEASPQKFIGGNVNVKCMTQLKLCQYHRRLAKRRGISSRCTIRDIWIIGIRQVYIRIQMPGKIVKFHCKQVGYNGRQYDDHAEQHEGHALPRSVTNEVLFDLVAGRTEL